MRDIMTTDRHAVHMNVMGACGVTKSKQRRSDILEKEKFIPDYDELLKAARDMHRWIFLHSGNEELAYKACGLSDEMNAFLGYFGSSTFTVPADEKE